MEDPLSPHHHATTPMASQHAHPAYPVYPAPSAQPYPVLGSSHPLPPLPQQQQHHLPPRDPQGNEDPSYLLSPPPQYTPTVPSTSPSPEHHGAHIDPTYSTVPYPIPSASVNSPAPPSQAPIVVAMTDHFLDSSSRQQALQQQQSFYEPSPYRPAVTIIQAPPQERVRLRRHRSSSLCSDLNNPKKPIAWVFALIFFGIIFGIMAKFIWRY